MYFNSKNLFIYNNLIKRPKITWYILSCFIFLFIIACWLIFIKKPLGKIINSQIKVLRELQVNSLEGASSQEPRKFTGDPENLNNLNNNSGNKNYNFNNKLSRNKLSNFNNNLNSLNESWNRLSPEFLEKNKNNDQIIKIIDEAARSGLKIKLYDYKPEIEKTWYSKYSFEIDVEGNFESINKLIEKLNHRENNLRFLDFIAKSNPAGLINLKMTVQMLGIK